MKSRESALGPVGVAGPNVNRTLRSQRLCGAAHVNWSPKAASPSTILAIVATSLFASVQLIGIPSVLAENNTSVTRRPAKESEHDVRPNAVQLPCSLKRGSVHTVNEVLDAETIRLDDTRLVRLIGALPLTAPAAAARSGTPPDEQAKSTLADLAIGRSARLYYPSVDRDRYGRTLAHVIVEAGPNESIWIQRHLITTGHARAYVLPGSAECIDTLIAHESAARNAGLGLWALAAHRPISSWRTRHLRRVAGTFQLVEGHVSRVGTSRGNVYLNFGRNRRFAFTAFIARASLNGQRSWLQELKNLEGRRIRVRGWIEIHNGPYIEVTHPNQIELLEKDQS